MKRSSLKERIYNQYQLLKNEVVIDLRKENNGEKIKRLSRTPNETRQTIKWRSKGY